MPVSLTKKLAKLTPKQRKFVRNRVKGMKIQAAALAAGYVAPPKNTPDVRAAFEALVLKACPPEKLASVLAAGLDAQHTEFAKFEGRITDRAETVAWSERRAYAELAAQYGGLVREETSQPTQQVAIIVQATK